MEGLYRFDDPATITCSNIIDDDVVRGENFGDISTATDEFHTQEVGDLLQFEGTITESPLLVSLSSDFDELIKTQISNHPRYPHLLSAYIDCRKVGAPPEMASLLEEIGRELNYTTTTTCNDLGVDPELDEFMDSYCEILQRCKDELSKPFDEVTTFLTNIESQLNNLCNDSLTSKSRDYASDEAAARSSPSSSEASGGENDQASESQESSGGNDEDIKGMLLRKYSGYLSKLRKEFMKKRKRGKLPKDAKSTLLHWWNSHFRWPYPTEEEKMKLGERTGLDQKQINNWFINQRKRHWKPSEDIRLAVVEGVRGTMAGREPAYFDTAANDTIT